jgi:hypothetical protein
MNAQTGPAVRIAMWSGPRNISTALMRAWGSRGDTVVVDEPFYAYYLAASGVDHPGRAQAMANQPTDWRAVIPGLIDEDLPDGRSIHYQKHMTHHMLPEVDLGWLGRVRNAFLIRDPADVVASYARRRGAFTLDDIGVVRQCELFEVIADRMGAPPPVIDARQVLADPAGVLARLCAALRVPFDPAMLSWPPGRRPTDGVWAPYWYSAVENSTGFGPPPPPSPALTGELARLAESARPFYQRHDRWRLV